MAEYFTVYFDTYFYVLLAKASDQEAEKVISELNNLHVRHVLSGQVINELITGKGKEHWDRALVKRMHLFNVEPYRISSSYFEVAKSSEEMSWDVLLLNGDLRVGLGDLFKSIHEMETIAKSFSISALNYSNKLGEIDFAEDENYSPEERIEKSLNFTSDLLSSLNSLNVMDDIDSITLDKNPENSPTENAIDLQNQLLSFLGSEKLEKLEEDNQITNSIVSSDNRPHKVVTGEASPKEIKRLGNTYRDSNHISLFVAHKEEIDLLQVDSAQLNLINNSKETHRIVEIGLQERCFSASSLRETVEIIAKKQKQLIG
jgi:hypothetical protein